MVIALFINNVDVINFNVSYWPNLTTLSITLLPGINIIDFHCNNVTMYTTGLDGHCNNVNMSMRCDCKVSFIIKNNNYNTIGNYTVHHYCNFS